MPKQIDVITEEQTLRLAELESMKTFSMAEAEELAELRHLSANSQIAEDDLKVQGSTILLDKTFVSKMNEKIEAGISKGIEDYKKSVKQFNIASGNGGKAVAGVEVNKSNLRVAKLKYYQAMLTGNQQKLMDASQALIKAEAQAGMRLYGALSTTGATTGQALVPTDFDKGLAKFRKSYDQLWKNAKVKVKTNGRPIKFNELTTEPTTTIVGEGASGSSATNITLGDNELKMRKYRTSQVYSAELEEDNELDDFELELVDSFGQSQMKKQQDEMCNGTTAGYEGILATAGVSVIYLGNSATSGKTTFGEIEFEDLDNMFAKLHDLSNFMADEGQFYMHVDIYNHLANSKDNQGGYHVPKAFDKKKGTAYNGNDINLVPLLPKNGQGAVGKKFFFFTHLAKTFGIGKGRSRIVVQNTGETDGINLNDTDQIAIVMYERVGHKVLKADGIVCGTTANS